MIPYAKHVILDRALPRIEDGLKPVQRRILFTMHELGLAPDKPYRKSARIVGDCLGKYHPHGDSSVYDAMVRMAQDFIMRMPLVDGHGNFGSIDGDTAAAMRYTEVRMQPLALELLRDIEKDTVKFELNFDDTLKEPVLLPGRFPNLLVNGASGIAVGLATSIPPHNLGESINACIAVMNNPDITVDGIMKIIPAPDFPTGGYLINSDEIKTAYETGKGRLVMRAKTHFEPQKNGKTLIVITELPYQVNKATMLTKILATSQKRKETIKAFAQIADIRDESDRVGFRAIIELKKDADPENVLKALYKYTDLQTNFSVNMMVIADGKPQQMGIIELIKGFLSHQEDVVTRRTKFDLEAAKKREHILDGLVTAILNIDEVIAIIRASKNPKSAKEALMARFLFTEIQAQAILDLRLQRLTNLELVAIQNEAKEIKATIKRLQAILGSRAMLLDVIRAELTTISEKYSNQRRTKLLDENESLDDYVDEIVQKPSFDARLEVFIEYDLNGVQDVKLSRRQMGTANPDETASSFTYGFDTQTNKQLKLFTNTGACLTLMVDEIPEQQKNKAKSRLTRLTSLIPIEEGERIVAAFVVDPEAEEKADCFFYTKQGNVKRTAFAEYATKNKRIVAAKLKDDLILDVELLSQEEIEQKSILMATKKGMSIRFMANTCPAMGRASGGVKCIKLDKDDECIFSKAIGDTGDLLLMTDRGYAKRSFAFDYDIQGRNGKGLKTFDFKRNGSNGTCIVYACFVEGKDFDLEVEQLHGTKTIVNTTAIRVERRASAGQVAVISVLDDVVVGVRAVTDKE
jgi:DNA gyrase subunit A